MDRRRFLTTSAGTLGTSLVVPRFLCAAADEFPDLVFAKGAPRDAVGRALETLGGIGRFVKDGDVVAIKPNASFPTPPTIGATTHPEVIGAIIEQVLSAGARRVLVVDHALGQAKRCFARCGLDKAVNAFTKAKLVTLDQQKAYQPVEVPSGKALKKTEVASIVQKADVLINVPTAKAHSATRVSFGLKNLMGLVWDRNTFHNDMDVHAGIADLATVIRADLTIVDAMYILMDNGPTGPGIRPTA